MGCIGDGVVCDDCIVGVDKGDGDVCGCVDGVI